MNRRHFFKLASGGMLMAAIPATGQGAVKNKAPIPGALGMLYDSTLCVGCQACVSRCQQVNHIKQDPHGGPYAGGADNWSNNDKLSPYTKNIIQVWSSGTGQHKDQTENGYAYIKKQCMHCVDPNCVSVCPVTALQKNPVTGVVHYDASVCIGCRYCMVACPFDVPKYDYDNPVGKISKCELCNQQGLSRLDRGELPGCVEVCPTGAVIFGKREDLLAEGKRRLGLKAGDTYRYPRQRLTDGDTYERQVARYDPHIYGELEGGGTQVLVLASVPFADLDLPLLAPLSTGERSEHLQHTLYQGMVLPLALLAGITTLVHRNMKKDSPDNPPDNPPDKEKDHHDDA